MRPNAATGEVAVLIGVLLGKFGGYLVECRDKKELHF